MAVNQKNTKPGQPDTGSVVPVPREVEVVRPVFGDNDRCCCCLSAVYPCRIYTHCFGVDQGGFQRQVGFPGSGILFGVWVVPVQHQCK